MGQRNPCVAFLEGRCPFSDEECPDEHYYIEEDAAESDFLGYDDDDDGDQHYLDDEEQLSPSRLTSEDLLESWLDELTLSPTSKTPSVSFSSSTATAAAPNTTTAAAASIPSKATTASANASAPCPDYERSMQCPRGKTCPMAHIIRFG
jgi:hypothetical protein